MERNVIWPTRSGDLQTRSIVFYEPFPEQGPSAGQGPTRSDAAPTGPAGRRAGDFLPVRDRTTGESCALVTSPTGRKVGDASSAAIDRRDSYRPFKTGDATDGRLAATSFSGGPNG